MDSHLSKAKTEVHGRIGFIIGYPFHFFVHKHVYEQFSSDAEFIVDLGIHAGRPPAPGLEQEIVSLLERHSVRYRILRYEEYQFPRHLEQFFAPYSALVSLWEQGCIRLPCNVEKKKINLIYGCGKDLTFLRPSRGIYDLIVAYGKHDYDLVSLLSPAVMVGNPKFDPWFKKKRHSQRARSHHKTLLYLPTHGDLSSIDRLAHQLTKLPPDWHVVTKLHYYTPREEPHRVHALTHPRIELHKDDVDLLELLERADVVLSDNSSAIFDAILADKPTVVADFWDATYLDTTHQNARWYRRGMTAGTTYSDSLEQRVKRDGSVLTIQDSAQLERVINEALADSAEIRAKRAELRKELFAYTDGSSSQRAADAMRDCIARTTPTKHPILHHAYEAYKVRVQLLPYNKEKVLLRRVTELEQALRETSTTTLPRIRIIQLCTESVVHSESLRSLREQDYPGSLYAISILSGENGDLSDSTPSLPLSTDIPITHVPVRQGHWGSSVAKAVSEATEEYIFFTTNACFVPRETLWRLASAIRNPTISAAGGYVRTEFEDQSESLVRVRRLLGVTTQPAQALLPRIEHSYAGIHPGGDIRCMLYRRSALAGIFLDSKDVPGVEAALLVYATRRGSVVFDPTHVMVRNRVPLWHAVTYAFKKGCNQYLFGAGVFFRMSALCSPRAMVFELLRFGFQTSVRFWSVELARRSGLLYGYMRWGKMPKDAASDGWLL